MEAVRRAAREDDCQPEVVCQGMQVFSSDGRLLHEPSRRRWPCCLKNGASRNTQTPRSTSAPRHLLSPPPSTHIPSLSTVTSITCVATADIDRSSKQASVDRITALKQAPTAAAAADAVSPSASLSPGPCAVAGCLSQPHPSPILLHRLPLVNNPSPPPTLATPIDFPLHAARHTHLPIGY